MPYLWDSRFNRDLRDFIALGAVDGWSVVHKFGNNNDVGTSRESVWSTGGIYSYLTSASAMEIVSTSADDTLAGSGARTVTVEGLDSSWQEISETAEMDGLTAVDLANSYLRVNRAYVATSGTYGQGSAGDIIVRVDGGGATQCTIDKTTADGIAWDYGQTEVARYTVPAGKQAFISRVEIVCESNKRADIAMFQRRNDATIASPYKARRVVESWSGVSQAFDHVFDAPILFPERTDIFFETRLSNGANGRVSVSFEIFVGPE